MTTDALNNLFERSKNDREIIVGSEIREVIGFARDLLSELSATRATIAKLRTALPKLPPWDTSERDLNDIGRLNYDTGVTIRQLRAALSASTSEEPSNA